MALKSGERGLIALALDASVLRLAGLLLQKPIEGLVAVIKGPGSRCSSL